MLELLYTSTKALSNYPSFMAYIKTWDALVAFINLEVHKVFRDGSEAYLGAWPYSLSLGNRVLGRHFYFENAVNAWCYAADEITGQFHSDLILNPNWKVPLAPGSHLDDMAGLYIEAGNPITIYDLSTGVRAGAVSTGFYVHNLAYAGNGRVMAVRHDTGDVALVNYLSQTVIWKSKVRPCRWSAYDCLHDLIITVESDKLVRIYLLNPVPATLTAPTFTPAAQRFQGCVVKTRLRGAHGEVCPGYWVRWEITGSPPKGTLFKMASKTDENGYAENYYYGPALGEEIGAETLKVSVKV